MSIQSHLLEMKLSSCAECTHFDEKIVIVVVKDVVVLLTFHLEQTSDSLKSPIWLPASTKLKD